MKHSARFLAVLLALALLAALLPVAGAAYDGDRMDQTELRELLNSVELHPQKTNYTVVDALLENCSDEDAPRFAAELFRHYHAPAEVEPDAAFALLDTVLNLPMQRVLEKNGFEQVWSDACWYKLKHGCAAYGVFWDPQRENGLGDVALRRLDLLNLFWEPGITDLQESRNLFLCALVPNDDITAAYPDVQPGNCGVELAQYLYDDAVDALDRALGAIPTEDEEI